MNALQNAIDPSMLAQMGGVSGVMEMMKGMQESGQMKSIMESMGMGGQTMPNAAQMQQAAQMMMGGGGGMKMPPGFSKNMMKMGRR